MDARAFAVEDVIQLKRLGMFRIELVTGASGSFDTLTVDGQDLLPAGAVAFDTSLAATALAIAAAINVNTNTHGFQACAAILDTLSEVIVYQTIAGAAATPAVAFTVTTITADFVFPAAETDNEIWGDTDSWISIEDANLAADDLGARFVMRVNPSFTLGQPKYIRHKGGSPTFINEPVLVSGVTHYKVTSTAGLISRLVPTDQWTLFGTEEGDLPVMGWTGEIVIATELTDVFEGEALLLYG